MIVSLVKSVPMFLLGTLLLISCKKEYSCEECKPTNDTTFNDGIRTTPNELVTKCYIYIEDESQVKWIYPQETNKLYYQTYKIFDSIRLDGSHQYNRTYNLKDYLPLNKYSIGDTFFVRYEIRMRYQPTEWVQIDTLIY